MRLALMLPVLLALVSCQSNTIKPTEATDAGLIPGSENPIIKKCAKGSAYIYKQYEIHVEPSPELQGMNIFLYAPEVSGGNPCMLDRKTASHIISTGETEGNNFFGGVYKNYLFIDQGTGPDGRILSVYDLSNKKLILLTEYSDPSIKDGILTYYKTLVPDSGVIKNIPCPDAGKWKDQGLTVLYEKMETFTLETETRVPVRQYRCKAGQ